MGKNRHSKDRLFITQTEHKYLYGGKKQEIRRAYKRTRLCCALTSRLCEHCANARPRLLC
jgi:hypothetical protein